MIASTPAAQHSEIYAIQLLRAVAASLVVFDHALLAISYETLGLARRNAAWAAGDLGVETFFAISGCLMMVTSLSAFGRPGATIRFLQRRFIRIAPLYWLVTTILLFMAIRKYGDVDIAHVAASYLFIPYEYAPGQTYPFLIQGWTLNYEMFFYLIFSIALLFDRRRGIIVLCGVFAALILAGAAMKPLWDTEGPKTILEVWTDPIIVTFLAGCLLALLRPSIARRPWPVVSPLVLAGLASLLLVVVGAAVVLASDTFPRPLPARWSLRAAAVAAVLVCLVPHGPPASQAGRLFYLLGNASFSTYLVHTFVIRYGLLAISTTPVTNEVVIVVALVIMANLAGLVLHLAVEMPMLRAFRSERGLLSVFGAARRLPSNSAAVPRDL